MSPVVSTAQENVQQQVQGQIRCTPKKPQTAEEMLASRPRVVKDGKIFFPEVRWDPETYEDFEVLVPYEEALASAQAAAKAIKEEGVEMIGSMIKNDF